MKDNNYSYSQFFMISFRLSDHELLWKYVDWVLEKDEELGIKVTFLFIYFLHHAVKTLIEHSDNEILCFG